MNDRWLKLAADMLDAAAEQLEDRGCHDWEWPGGWAAADKLDFVCPDKKDGDTPEEPDEFGMPERSACYFIADRLRKMTKGAGQ